MSTAHSDQKGASRREFLERCLSATAGLTIVAVSPLLQSCESYVDPAPPSSGSNTFDVSSLAVGQGMMTTSRGSDGFPIMIIRQGEATYIALSSLCTHAGCQTEPPSNGSIVCKCHFSQFDLNGNPIAGLATTPLAKYTVTYNPSDKTVTVTT